MLKKKKKKKLTRVHVQSSRFYPQYPINQVWWHMFNPSIEEVEEGRWKVQCHPQLCTEFKANLDYIRLGFRKK